MQQMEKRFSRITNIFVNDNNVDRHEEDEFPYHYSKSTYEAFLRQWNKKEIQANQQNCGRLIFGDGDAS